MKTKNKVKRLLAQRPKLRDSDSKLIARYWFNELEAMGLDAEEVTAYELLCMVAASKLSSSETIRRVRRKLQEECPELRGSMYVARKGKIQNEWKKALGYGHN